MKPLKKAYRLLCLLMALMMLCILCACQGSLGSVDLQNPVEIPQDGIIPRDTIAQIQREQSVARFYGESNGCRYQWTVLGADITQPRQVDLRVTLGENENGDVKMTLSQDGAFGFTALLSVTLSENWNAQSGTAYQNGQSFAPVSITGSTETILNVSLDGGVKEFLVCPDAPLEDPQTQPGETTNPTEGEKDLYQTDPIPEGKPKPVEPENQDVNKGKAYTCTFSIECATIMNNLEQLDPEKLEMVPSGGVILPKTTVTFYEGESVFDVLQRICKEKGIHLEFSWTPIYNSAYIEGIHNLYEFDCGELSGWMYRVNSWYPNYGCSRYQLKDGDNVEWRYTCDLGNDVGGKNIF